MTIRCNRCALCCHYLEPVTGNIKKCPYLAKLHSSKGYYCKRWKARNIALSNGWGFKIAKYLDPGDYRIKPVICVKRENSRYDYPDCPYNEGREIAPWLIQET